MTKKVGKFLTKNVFFGRPRCLDLIVKNSVVRYWQYIVSPNYCWIIKDFIHLTK